MNQISGDRTEREQRFIKLMSQATPEQMATAFGNVIAELDLDECPIESEEFGNLARMFDLCRSIARNGNEWP